MITFTFESPLVLEETFKDYVIVEATLLTEGVSKHGYLYTVDDTDFNLVAETAVNKPIYYGTNVFGEHKAPPIKGQYLQSHSGKFERVKPVGKIIKAWFDKALRKVKAKIKIWDSGLIHNIKRGFKISIRGIFDKFKNVIWRGKNAIKVIGLKIKDVQIVDPTTKTGVKGAKVERVLEETMSFSFPEDELLAAVIAKLVVDGVI